jgi:hypothetical protein
VESGCDLAAPHSGRDKLKDVTLKWCYLAALAGRKIRTPVAVILRRAHYLSVALHFYCPPQWRSFNAYQD